eukprot:9068805-Lingulodinium_polyedra.AAC.1
MKVVWEARRPSRRRRPAIGVDVRFAGGQFRRVWRHQPRPSSPPIRIGFDADPGGVRRAVLSPAFLYADRAR